MEFVAIDVETANADLSSICQIGLASYENGRLVETWESLINPEENFDQINVSIHGIRKTDVASSPKLKDVYDKLKEMIEGKIVVSHMSFDRVAIHRALDKSSLSLIDCEWIDTAKVARRTWSQFSKKGYGLANIASTFGILFDHHNALEDAKVCGEILVRALTETSTSISELTKQLDQPIAGSSANRLALEGNPNGPLFGEVIVFTGALLIPRKEAALLASEAGCEVSSGVKKSVTVLVVGDQDTKCLAGHDKSSKHRKAEELIEKGHSIKIIGESDFKKLISM